MLSGISYEYDTLNRSSGQGWRDHYYFMLCYGITVYVIA